MLFYGISRDSKMKYCSDVYLFIVWVSRHIYIGSQYAIMHPKVVLRDLKILCFSFCFLFFLTVLNTLKADSFFFMDKPEPNDIKEQ